MKRAAELLAVGGAGAALLVIRPPWTSSIEDRVVVVCWAAALGLWAWLVAVGTLHAWATRTGRRRWRRWSGALLPGAVRRRVEQVAMAGMLVVPVAACGTGAEQPAAPVLVLEEAVSLDPVDAGAGSPTTTSPVQAPGATAEPAPSASTTVVEPDPAPEVTPAPVPGPSAAPSTPAPDAGGSTDPAPWPPAPPADTPSPSAEPAITVDPRLDAADPADDPAFRVPAEAGSRVVLRGDNLWSIAADHLASLTGRTPTTDEVRPYWAALVAENGPTLASGNPDVIYAGEVIRLPAAP